MTSEPIDLKKVVTEVLTDLEFYVSEGGGSVEVGELPTIEADEAKMRQLFQNLIGNAIKYAKEHEKPLVKITGQVIDGVAHIQVEDNGIGFEDQYLDRIFRPFQRLHGKTSRYEGIGMGLTICRKAVDLHRGTITARSKPGQGATFIITLPIKQVEGDAIHSAQFLNRSGKLIGH
jgi:light-regulated signal transduction histidine kinase (bacteriophytochrome)